MNSMLALSGVAIKDGGIVVDIGPGIKPQKLVNADELRLVEPHFEYVAILENNGFTTYQMTGLEYLKNSSKVDTVTMLDVIEHMEKEEAKEVIALAKEKADQVIIFTPIGFMKQTYKKGERDAWGLNGAEWQTHKSGWMPEEFPDWSVSVSPNFHGERGGAFMAIWKKSKGSGWAGLDGIGDWRK